MLTCHHWSARLPPISQEVLMISTRKMGFIMTSSNGNIFRITGHLCGDFTVHRSMPCTKASDTELCFFICAWLNGWINNCEAGDLRCHHAHYDVIVMGKFTCKIMSHFSENSELKHERERHEHAEIHNQLYYTCSWPGDARNLNH